MSFQILLIDADETPEEAVEALSKVGHVIKHNYSGESNRAIFLNSLKEVDVLWVGLGQYINEEVFASAPQLKILVTVTTGHDHIDKVAMERYGVQLLSLRGETDFLKTICATAELTWGLLLSISRHLFTAANTVKSGKWDRSHFKGFELYEKEIGIVGLGRLGSRVAEYAKAFNMKVSAFDPNIASKDWPIEVNRYDNLEDLFRSSDIITLHLHLTNDSESVIDERLISLMKTTAILVNTSRGGLIDEIALEKALTSNRIAGFAADVVWGEHTDVTSPIRKLFENGSDNVLLTPHLGGFTFESRSRAENFMAQKLKQFLEAADGI